MMKKLWKVLLELVIQSTICQTAELANDGRAFLLKTSGCTVVLKFPVIVIDMLFQFNMAIYAVNVHTNENGVVFSLEVERASVNVEDLFKPILSSL